MQCPGAFQVPPEKGKKKMEERKGGKHAEGVWYGVWRKRVGVGPPGSALAVTGFIVPILC